MNTQSNNQPITLKVGQVWRTRSSGDAKLVYITRKFRSGFYCEVKDGVIHKYFTVSSNGSYWSDDKPSQYDLVTLVKDAPEQSNAVPPPSNPSVTHSLDFRVGKVYTTKGGNQVTKPLLLQKGHRYEAIKVVSGAIFGFGIAVILLNIFNMIG